MLFVILVSCLPSLKECPIPGGYRHEVKMKNHSECIKNTELTIDNLGFDHKLFSISCKEK